MDSPSTTTLVAASAATATVFSAQINGLIAIWNSRQVRKAEEARRKQDREAEEARYLRDREAEELRHKRDQEIEEQRSIRELDAEQRKLDADRDAESRKQLRDLAVKLALEAWRRKVDVWEKDEGGQGKGFGLRGKPDEPRLENVVGEYIRTLNALERK